MKHLLLLLFFSGSLDSFSQDGGSGKIDTASKPIPVPAFIYTMRTGELMPSNNGIVKPDTLRATLIVYLDRGPAILHTKRGFVVFKGWEVACYLDDKKRVVKKPWEVLTYKIKK